MTTTTTNDVKSRLRGLPSVTEADRHLEQRGLPSGKPVRAIVQREIDRFRKQALESLEEAPPPEKNEVLRAIEAAVSRPAPNQLRRVINATGVVVHTNLGRAVLPPSLTGAVEALHHAYLNLEFDLETGKRGERGGRVP